MAPVDRRDACPAARLLGPPEGEADVEALRVELMLQQLQLINATVGFCSWSTARHESAGGSWHLRNASLQD